MLLYFTISCVVVVIVLLLMNPVWGIMAAFIVRPLVDALWSEYLVVGFKLTELFSVLIPILILSHLLFTYRGRLAFQTMPCRVIWIVYVFNITFFSAIILYQEGMLSGLNVFFRHLNGFIAFYMVQAFFSDEKKIKYFLFSLIIAGLFPMGIGLYQIMTGVQWIVTGVEGVTRNIGLYHDAITVRYYAMQTILALILYGSLYVRDDIINKLLLMVYGVVSVAVMFKAYSKSGMVALALWILTWSAFQKKYNMLILTGFVVILVSVYYENDIFEQINTVFNKEISALDGSGDMERTFNGRWYIWEDAINEWKKYGLISKIFGTGHVATNMHNDYLMFLFHGGIIGLFIYMVLLMIVAIKITKNLFEKNDALTLGALMAFIMWSIDTVGLVPSAYSGYQWFVWGIIGLALKMRIHEKENNESITNSEKENIFHERTSLYNEKKLIIKRNL